MPNPQTKIVRRERKVEILITGPLTVGALLEVLNGCPDTDVVSIRSDSNQMDGTSHNIVVKEQ